MTITITIPFPDRARATEHGGLRSALAALGWAVAVEVAEDLVPGLGVAVALGRVARAACAAAAVGDIARADVPVDDEEELAG